MAAVALALGAAGLAAADNAQPFSPAGPAGASTGIVLDVTGRNQAAVAISQLMPGDSITQALVVRNSSELDLRYSIETSSTDPDGKALRDVLILTVKSSDVTTAVTPCDDFDGTTVLPPTVLGDGNARLGDPRVGYRLGDRQLAAGDSETLCLRVSMALEADNRHQGATTEAGFVLAGEQITPGEAQP